MTGLKKKLYKWPIEESAVIAAKVKRVSWPVSVRSYVKEVGTCIGLTSGVSGVRVYPHPKDVCQVARRVNAALCRWADQHAPKGFGWTSLQMNVNTYSEWHYDHKNEGPSLLLIVGDHLGGEFECRGVHSTKFDGELALIDGRTWHRNHAAWEGDRVSFVAFTNSDWKSADGVNLQHLKELVSFARP